MWSPFSVCLCAWHPNVCYLLSSSPCVSQACQGWSICPQANSLIHYPIFLTLSLPRSLFMQLSGTLSHFFLCLAFSLCFFFFLCHSLLSLFLPHTVYTHKGTHTHTQAVDSPDTSLSGDIQTTLVPACARMRTCAPPARRLSSSLRSLCLRWINSRIKTATGWSDGGNKEWRQPSGAVMVWCEGGEWDEWEYGWGGWQGTKKSELRKINLEVGTRGTEWHLRRTEATRAWELWGN